MLKLVNPPRKTVGQIVTDLAHKQDDSYDPIELQREILNERKYWKIVWDAVDKGKSFNFGSPFYIVVLTRRERILQKTLRNQAFPRRSCPTPDYDQTVFQYDRTQDGLKFLWTIPSMDAAMMLKRDAALVKKSEWPLLKHVLAFYDGSLLAFAKKLNNETSLSPIITIQELA